MNIYIPETVVSQVQIQAKRQSKVSCRMVGLAHVFTHVCIWPMTHTYTCVCVDTYVFGPWLDRGRRELTRESRFQ